MLEVDGDGPTVLFVHGLGGTSNTFHLLLDSLTGFRCIRPDFPGSGRSAMPLSALTMNGFVQVISDVVRSVAGGPVHLVGHSMGALVCQHFASQTPDLVSSLTLFGPILEPSDAARQRLKERADAARKSDLIDIADTATETISSSMKIENPVARSFVRESHMRQDAEGFAQTCEALATAKAADLRFVRCPTLVVTGRDDSVAPPSAAQSLADKVKGSAVKILERCGHWTPVERPQDCARLLSEHLRARRSQ